MEFVRCTEVVRLLESPLLEVSLYIYKSWLVHSSVVDLNDVACTIICPSTQVTAWPEVTSMSAVVVS